MKSFPGQQYSNTQRVLQYESLKSKDPSKSMEEFGITPEDVEAILLRVRSTIPPDLFERWGIRAESYGPLLSVGPVRFPSRPPDDWHPKCRACRFQPEDLGELLMLWFLNLDFSPNSPHRAQEKMMHRILVCKDRAGCQFRVAVR